MARVAAAGQLRFETVHVAARGQPVPVEVNSRVVELGDRRVFVAVVRDVSANKAAEARILRLNRTLRTLSEINQVIALEEDPDRLLARVCEAAVTYGGFRMAWLGRAEPDGRVRALASAGDHEGYLQGAPIRWDDTPEGRGPAGTAIREGRTVAVERLAAEPGFEPWRGAAARSGFRSSIATPVRIRGERFGALSLYAAEPQAMDREVLELVEELASDLGLALQAFEDRRRLRESERGLANAQRMAHLGGDKYRPRQRPARLVRRGVPHLRPRSRELRRSRRGLLRARAPGRRRLRPAGRRRRPRRRPATRLRAPHRATGRRGARAARAVRVRARPRRPRRPQPRRRAGHHRAPAGGGRARRAARAAPAAVRAAAHSVPADGPGPHDPRVEPGGRARVRVHARRGGRPVAIRPDHFGEAPPAAPAVHGGAHQGRPHDRSGQPERHEGRAAHRLRVARHPAARPRRHAHRFHGDGPGRDRAPAGRRPARRRAARSRGGPEDGGRRPARRRHRARLQQPAHRRARLRRVPPRAPSARRSRARRPRGDPAGRRARRAPDRTAAGLQPPPDPGAEAARPQRDGRRAGAAARSGHRRGHRSRHAPGGRARPRGRRPGAPRPGAHEPGGQRARRHARRRPPHDRDAQRRRRRRRRGGPSRHHAGRLRLPVGQRHGQRHVA